jgi:hypothetical protein
VAWRANPQLLRLGAGLAIFFGCAT